MYRLINAIVIFIVIGTNLQASELIDLYSRYMPGIIYQDPVFKNGENLRLSKYGKLNPDLIPIYIEHINLKLKDKIINADSNYAHLLKFSLDKNESKKNEWARSQMQYVNRTITTFPKKKKLLSYLENYIRLKSINDIVKFTLNLDENKSEYYKYIYFSNSYEDYSPDVVYKEKNDKEIKMLVKDFEKKIKEYDVLDYSSRMKLIKKAEKYSYLFKDSYLGNQYINTTFTFAQFVEKMIYLDYQEKSGFDIGFSYTPLPISVEKAIYLEDPFGQKFQYDVDINNLTYFKIGYSQAINSEKSLFSSINGTIGLSLFKTIPLKNRFDIWEGMRSITGLRVQGKYYIENIKLKSFFSGMAEIQTPVFYLSRNTFFEIGLIYTYIFTSLEYDFVFEGDVYAAYSSDAADFFENGKYTEDKHNHIIYPVLSLTYFQSEHIKIKLNYLIYKSILVGISYKF